MAGAGQDQEEGGEPREGHSLGIGDASGTLPALTPSLPGPQRGTVVWVWPGHAGVHVQRHTYLLFGPLDKIPNFLGV